MSSTYRIHGARFLRKYTAAERSSSYAYMADVAKIANTLCKVPWERVTRDVAATMPMHTEEAIDWNAPERDRFDAAEWCAEHSDGMHRAYAQAACYMFELPDSAVGTAIEKIAVNVTSDPYNPYGARISALTSATPTIPMDCATVRTGDVYRAPDEDGLGAAPRLYVTNSDGTQTWYSNSEVVELVPSATLAAKKYLFVFVCLENYNRGRNGWIEGSSYIDNDVALTLASACADLDGSELNELAPARIPTTLKLLNLATGATDATLTLSGPVFSMTQVFLDESGSPPNRYAVITGDFDEYSVSGMPGFVIYNSGSKAIVSISEESGHEIPSAVKAAWRMKGVKARWSPLYGVRMAFDYVPASASAKVRLAFTKSNNTVKVSYEGTASVDFTSSMEAVDRYVPVDDSTAMRIYNDRIAMSSLEDLSNSWANAWATNQLALAGSVTSVAASFYGFVIVAGSNEIAGNKSAVKLVTVGGDVVDYFVDLTPDDFTDFAAYEFLPNNPSTVAAYYDAQPTPSAYSDSRFTADSAGYRLVTANGLADPQTIKFAGVGSESIPCPGVALLLTGRFRSIGGVKANGAAILTYIRHDSTQDCVLALHPLNVGPVKRGVIFCAATSQLPNNVSHILVEPVS